MKAKVYFNTPDGSGIFETEILGQSFKDWCVEVGNASASTGGNGYFVNDKLSFPLRYITRIEKVED